MKRTMWSINYIISFSNYKSEIITRIISEYIVEFIWEINMHDRNWILVNVEVDDGLLETNNFNFFLEKSNSFIPILTIISQSLLSLDKEIQIMLILCCEWNVQMNIFPFDIKQLPGS